MKGDQEQIKQLLMGIATKVGINPEDVEQRLAEERKKAAASVKPSQAKPSEGIQGARGAQQNAQGDGSGTPGGNLFEKATGKPLKEGSSVKDALGLTDAMIEGIYGQAYRLYNTGKFKDASQIFRMLVMLNSNDSRFLMGLAACHHMLKDFLSAINTYTVCSMLDGENPVPLYHASDCMIQIGDHASALIVLEMAAERAGNRPEYKTLKDRAQLTIESLKKEVAKITSK